MSQEWGHCRVLETWRLGAWLLLQEGGHWQGGPQVPWVAAGDFGLLSTPEGPPGHQQGQGSSHGVPVPHSHSPGWKEASLGGHERQGVVSALTLVYKPLL